MLQVGEVITPPPTGRDDVVRLTATSERCESHAALVVELTLVAVPTCHLGAQRGPLGR